MASRPRAFVRATVLASVVLTVAFFTAPASADAICRDGTYSYSSGSGTCSWHGGVDYWIDNDPAHSRHYATERADQSSDNEEGRSDNDKTLLRYGFVGLLSAIFGGWFVRQNTRG